MASRFSSISFLFFCLLAYFVFSGGWHEPAQLVIKGQAPGTDAVVRVQWDSGAGYNSYEQEEFHFLATRGSLDEPHTILVRGGKEKNPLSRDAQVILYEIRIDDQGIYIPPEALHGVRLIPGKGWLFESADSKVILSLPVVHHISFLFKTDNRSGVAGISINGQETRHDLYRSNWVILVKKINFWFLDEQNGFAVSCATPRYDVDELRIAVPEGTLISSVSLKTRTGRVIDLPLSGKQSGGNLLISAPTAQLKHYFSLSRFTLQVCFALVMTLVVCSLLRAISRYGGAGEFFLGKKMRWLHVFITGGLVSFSLWLAAFWPGVLSVDSLNIWRAARLPEEMINDHPMLNVLWYMFLQHLWDNVAVVPVSQVVLLSILTGVTFFFCYQQGVRLCLLLPCYLLFLLSLPVGLYTITLWKDIPFALLVVFWALVPAYLLFRKKQGEPVRISSVNIVLLVLLFAALLLFRHNGIIYLFVLPVLFVVTGLARVSGKLLIAGGVLAAGLFLLILFPPSSIKGASYFHDLTLQYFQQVGRESPATRFSSAVRHYPRLLDLKKNKAESDFWHYYLNDRYAWTFLRESGWNDTFAYHDPDNPPAPALRSFALKLYKNSLDYPWIYLSWNPFWLLYLFPLTLLFYRRFPLSAVFSCVILSQVLAMLLVVGTVNWRYYYFVLLGGYFLLPVLLLDCYSSGTSQGKGER